MLARISNYGDAGSSYHEIGVDDIVERLQKDTHDAKSDEQSRARRHDPMDIRAISGPSEPE